MACWGWPWLISSSGGCQPGTPAPPRGSEMTRWRPSPAGRAAPGLHPGPGPPGRSAHPGPVIPDGQVVQYPVLGLHPAEPSSSRTRASSLSSGSAPRRHRPAATGRRGPWGPAGCRGRGGRAGCRAGKSRLQKGRAREHGAPWWLGRDGMAWGAAQPWRGEAMSMVLFRPGLRAESKNRARQGE